MTLAKWRAKETRLTCLVALHWCALGSLSLFDEAPWRPLSVEGIMHGRKEKNENLLAYLNHVLKIKWSIYILLVHIFRNMLGKVMKVIKWQWQQNKQQQSPQNTHKKSYKIYKNDFSKKWNYIKTKQTNPQTTAAEMTFGLRRGKF